jgi:hypothetical protein
MTEAKRLLTIHELLEEQRHLERGIDQTQIQFNASTDDYLKLRLTTELTNYQSRLREVQEGLRKCKKQ